MLEEVQLPLDIHPDPHRPRDQPAFSFDEVIVRERRRVRLTERPVSKRDVELVNRRFGLIGHRESRSSTENLLYGPRRALVKIDAHAFRRVQAVMDAVRNTYTPVSRARQEETRPPREPLIDSSQPLEMAHDILRHRSQPAIN